MRILQGDGTLEANNRLVEPLQFRKADTAVDLRPVSFWIEPDGGFVKGQCFFVPLAHQQHVGQRVVVRNVLGL